MDDLATVLDMSPFWWGLCFVVWCHWAVLGYIAGQKKNQEISGLCWCFLLGPFGILVLHSLPVRQEAGAPGALPPPLDRDAPCVHCARTVPAGMRMCPNCGRAAQARA